MPYKYKNKKTRLNVFDLNRAWDSSLFNEANAYEECVSVLYDIYISGNTGDTYHETVECYTDPGTVSKASLHAPLIKELPNPDGAL